MSAMSVSKFKRPSQTMIYVDTVTHYLYSPLVDNYKFTMDLDGDGKSDSMDDYGVAYNWGRPTVHNNGANVTAADGHIERVSFKVLWSYITPNVMASQWWYVE